MNILRFLIVIIYVFISAFFAQAGNVTFHVVTSEPTYECRIVGNFNGWSILNSIPCKKIDNTHFTVTLNDSTWADSVDLSNIRYKYVKCPCDWSCVEKGKLGEETSKRIYRANVNDTIFSWVNFPMASLIPIKVKTPPQTEECYLIGSFNNWIVSGELWKMDKYDVEENDSVVFITYFVVSLCGDDTKYQFCCGPSMEYIQTDPVDTFLLSQTVYPTVKAWNKTFKTSLNFSSTDKISISSHGSKIIIDGLSEDEEILIFDIIGRLKYKFNASGQVRTAIDVAKGSYILKIHSQSKLMTFKTNVYF